MKAAKPAVCCGDGCENNVSARTVLCCSREGRCAACALHDGCAARSGGLVDPVVALCGGCQNGANGLQTLCCTACGRCGNCSTHPHG